MPEASPPAQPQYLLIGQILRPHGVKGELRVRVMTDYPERIGQLKAIYLSPQPEPTAPTPYHLRSARLHQGYALLTLREVPDRDAAERMRNLYVLVALADAVPLEADEVYLYQLIGMAVVTESGEALGTLVEVLETGANDVYVVRGARGEILIPVIDGVILQTDTEARRITARLPDGLIAG